MNGTAMTSPRTCEWTIDGLRLAGLAWGPEDGIPVLALHGWMDHAASFQELAPRLTDCHVVALDLSGQGHSARRAAHASYNIWDDLPQIAALLDRLGWQDCVLLGHSRGANISALFAAALPERTRALIALDSIAPEPTDDGFTPTLRAFILQGRARMARPSRVFATRAEYVARRRQQGNTAQTSEALADRALEKVHEGFRMRGDPRLFASSAVKLTRAHVEDVLRAIRCPVLNIWAGAGVRSRRAGLDALAGLAARLIPRYETIELDGDHHFHLDPAAAAKIADAIKDFLIRHDAETPRKADQDAAPPKP